MRVVTRTNTKSTSKTACGSRFFETRLSDTTAGARISSWRILDFDEGRHMNIKFTKRFWLRLSVLCVIAFATYWALLCFPQPFFRSSVEANNLALYSDQSFTPEAGKRILDTVEAKLAGSPLYSERERHAAFICNARWRQRLFFNRNYGVGGVNQYPLTTNVFLRDATIEDNRLISPSGSPVPGDRTLDYFIAHEITHTLTVRAVGWLRYFKLPQWVREGYADYVAKGTAFDYEAARRSFLAADPEMDWQRSGLYLRYHLLVAHLLDKQHWTVRQLLESPPEQGVVEEQVRRYSN
jgi:hypothetical protein